MSDEQLAVMPERETLAAIFASRVKLAKQTLEQAVDAATADYVRTVAWIKSSRTQEGSFLWFCDLFDLDAGAVRKAIKDRKV